MMHGVRGRGAPLNTPHSASSSGPTCETVRDCSARGITFRASMSVWTSPQPILSSTGAGAPTCRSGYPRAVIRRARFKCLGSRSARSKSAAGFIVTPVKQKWVLLSIEIKKIRFDKILKVRSSKAFKKGKNERSIFFGIKCPKSCDGLFVFFGALSVDFDRPPFSHSATTGRS